MFLMNLLLCDTLNIMMKKSPSRKLMTCEDIERFSRLNGVVLRPQVSANVGLTIEAYVTGEENAKPIGYLSAFIRPIPGKLLHLDTIQVKNRRQSLGFKRRGWSMSGPGISFIMGSWALRWAYDRGCTYTELLAVKDTPEMHHILTRLYESFGFERVRDVGDGISSISDRLIWGAVGTLMRMNLDSFLTEWTPKLEALTAVRTDETSTDGTDEIA